jgi:malic enzyme
MTFKKLLNKYRDQVLCFNDDIQGTGATSLAGVLGGLRAKGEHPNALGDQRILIAGAGSAGMSQTIASSRTLFSSLFLFHIFCLINQLGIGVAQVLYQAMIEHGRTEEEAKNCFFIADEKGYVHLHDVFLLRSIAYGIVSKLFPFL